MKSKKKTNSKSRVIKILKEDVSKACLFSIRILIFQDDIGTQLDYNGFVCHNFEFNRFMNHLTIVKGKSLYKIGDIILELYVFMSHGCQMLKSEVTALRSSDSS